MIVANVTNYGDRPTTINALCYFYYEKQKLFRKTPWRCYVVPNQNDAQELPFELKPGTEWRGLAIQDPEVEDMAQTGVLDLLVYHSHSTKPLRRRVIIPRRSSSQLTTQGNSDDLVSNSAGTD